MEGVTVPDILLTVITALIAWAVPVIMEMRRNIRDLWKWHAPDDAGRQVWKYDMDALILSLNKLTIAIERSLDRQP